MTTRIDLLSPSPSILQKGSLSLDLKPNLETPTTKCLGLELVKLAERIDSNNVNYVDVCKAIYNSLMSHMQGFSVEHVKKLEDKVSLVQSGNFWSSIVNFCSLIGSAIAFYIGLSSQNPSSSALAIGLALLPFVYEALSCGIEQKELEKGVFKFGAIAGVALFLKYFKVQLPAFNPSMINPSFVILKTVTKIMKNFYDTRITWKKGEIEALKFLMEEIQKKIETMTESMGNNISKTLFNESVISDVLRNYLDTIKTILQ